MSEVTVICCWNDEKMYGDFVNTLKTQDCPYELIGIDNRGNGAFKSCAAAYNSVINQVKTKYVVYSHQDILMNEPDTLGKFVAYLERTGLDDILGAAGCKFDTKGVFADFKHVIKLTGELKPAGDYEVEDGFMEADTLDECFFGGHAEHFMRNPFDEVVCSGWHLYAAEACLRTKSNNVGGGGRSIYLQCGYSASLKR